MIEFIHQHWAAITVAAAWFGREVRNFNVWVFEVLEYLQAHGGLKNYLRKTWNNPETGGVK
jgi:hypothetical protein